MAFDPFREARSNLIGEPDVIQVPIYIDIRTEHAVPVVMVELLIEAINFAAIGADLDTFGRFYSRAAAAHGGALPGVTEFGNGTQPPVDHLYASRLYRGRRHNSSWLRVGLQKVHRTWLGQV